MLISQPLLFWPKIAKIFLDAGAVNLVQKKWSRLVAFQPFRRLFIPPAGFSRQYGLLNEGGSVKSQQIDFFLSSVVSFFSGFLLWK